MPTGGNYTNVVLAAYRGYHGIPMFRELLMIKKKRGSIHEKNTSGHTGQKRFKKCEE